MSPLPHLPIPRGVHTGALRGPAPGRAVSTRSMRLRRAVPVPQPVGDRGALLLLGDPRATVPGPGRAAKDAGLRIGGRKQSALPLHS
jgi:hypothetical protein